MGEFEKDLEELKRCSENNDCVDFFRHYEKLIKKIGYILIEKFRENKNRIEELYHEVVVVVLSNERKTLKKFDATKRIKVSSYISGIAFKVIYNVLTKKEKGEEEGKGEKEVEVEGDGDGEEYENGKEKGEKDDLGDNEQKDKPKRTQKIVHGLDIENLIETNNIQENNIIYELDYEKINILYQTCFKNLSVLEKNIYKLSQEKHKKDEYISGFLNKSIGSIYTTKCRAVKKMKSCMSINLGIDKK